MKRIYLRHAVAMTLCTWPAFAQPNPPPASSAAMSSTAAPPMSAPSPEALNLARTLTEKSGGGGFETMTGLSLPMARLMHELQVGPMHANVVIHDAVLPTLYDHKAELSEIQAQSYAATLSTDDMKAAIAFYESKAGQDLLRARPHVMTGNMAGVTKLFDSLMPEFEKRTDGVLKQNGWTKMAPPPSDSMQPGSPPARK